MFLQKLFERGMSGVTVKLLEEKLEAEAQLERQQTRERLAAELVEVLADDLEHAEAHAPRLAEAHACVEAARAQWEAAQRQYSVVYAERRLVSLEADRRRGRLEKQLIDSAPSIGAFVDTMRGLIEQCQHSADTVSHKDIDGKWHTAWSNHRSIGARVDAIRRACAAAVALQFTALDEPTLMARLEDLKADLPDVEPRPAKWAA